MKKRDVEHVLRAAGAATGRNRFVLIGSAAVVAWLDATPEAMSISRDVDLFADDTPDPEAVSDLLEGSLGIASTFDLTFGYYCDGVGPNTAALPTGWEARARAFSSPNTNGVTAIVPEPNDIALSKLAVWRPKDIDWLRVAVAHNIISTVEMRARLGAMPPRAGAMDILSGRLDALDA